MSKDIQKALEAFEKLLNLMDEHCETYAVETLEQDYGDDYTDLVEPIRSVLDRAIQEQGVVGEEIMRDLSVYGVTVAKDGERIPPEKFFTQQYISSVEQPVEAGDEIKPCPFCGSDYVHVDSSRSMQHSGIRCGDCNANISGECPEETIKEAWNTRTQSGDGGGIDEHEFFKELKRLLQIHPDEKEKDVFSGKFHNERVSLALTVGEKALRYMRRPRPRVEAIEGLDRALKFYAKATPDANIWPILQAARAYSQGHLRTGSGKCPMGKDCDLTVAYMLGVEHGKDALKDRGDGCS